MFCNHPVSDLVARINNGYMAKKEIIYSPSSCLREDVLNIMKAEGYILHYSKIADGSNENFKVHLKYTCGVPAVKEICVVSKPGRRVYVSSSKIPLVKNGLGVVVLSTSAGVIVGYEARNKNLGGEILLKIF